MEIYSRVKRDDETVKTNGSLPNPSNSFLVAYANWKQDSRMPLILVVCIMQESNRNKPNKDQELYTFL